MAIENIIKLMEIAQDKPELASKLQTADSPEVVVGLGAVEGLEFTTEEAEAFREQLIKLQDESENGELSEEALEAVAGGRRLPWLPFFPRGPW
ncbi:MAG: Nif11-like leader peptide family RiPP precursor [Sphaerospermopsis kisseleviana]